MRELTNIEINIIYTIYEAFGGACSLRQLLQLEDATQEIVVGLVEDNYLRITYIDDTPFVVCRHLVYRCASNDNQNYRLTTYNIKKSCLLAEYWLSKHTSARTIAAMLPYGTMHQNTTGAWDEYMAYLHAQGYYEYFAIPEEQTRYMVYFPKSNDPMTLANNIKRFFDNEGKFEDIADLSPYLTVYVPTERIKDAILRRIDARYWWIMNRLEILPLACPDTTDLI